MVERCDTVHCMLLYTILMQDLNMYNMFVVIA